MNVVLFLQVNWIKYGKTNWLKDDIDLSFYDGVRLGAKWQSERMYSEEDLEKAFKHGILFKEESVSTCEEAIDVEFSMLVEQFKKK